MKATAILAAYNEGPRIGQVLAIVTAHPLIASTIVVDDGSTDDTAVEARKYPVSIISTRHAGKGRALARGVAETESPVLFFCDADIRDLTREDITRIVQPVLGSASEMCIGARMSKIRRCGPFAWSPLLDGQRAVSRRLWDEVPDFLKRGYMIEVALNTTARRLGLKTLVEYVALSQFTKEEKYGAVSGRVSRLSMFTEVLAAQILARCAPLTRMSQAESRLLGWIES